MKKIMMVAALAVASLSASAQVYLGGGVSFHSAKPAHFENASVDSKTTISLLPEIGYKLDDQISFGIGLGYSHSKQGDFKTDAYSIEPYLRYTFARWNNVSFFGEVGFGYSHSENTTEVDDDTELTTGKVNTWYIGVRPGIAIDLTKNFTFLTKIGWLGYKSSKPDVDHMKASSDFGLDVSGENIQFSLQYNF